MADEFFTPIAKVLLFEFYISTVRDCRSASVEGLSYPAHHPGEY